MLNRSVPWQKLPIYLGLLGSLWLVVMFVARNSAGETGGTCHPKANKKARIDPGVAAVWEDSGYAVLDQLEGTTEVAATKSAGRGEEFRLAIGDYPNRSTVVYSSRDELEFARWLSRDYIAVRFEDELIILERKTGWSRALSVTLAARVEPEGVGIANRKLAVAVPALISGDSIEIEWWIEVFSLVTGKRLAEYPIPDFEESAYANISLDFGNGRLSVRNDEKVVFAQTLTDIGFSNRELGDLGRFTPCSPKPAKRAQCEKNGTVCWPTLDDFSVLRSYGTPYGSGKEVDDLHVGVDLEGPVVLAVRSGKVEGIDRGLARGTLKVETARGGKLEQGALCRDLGEDCYLHIRPAACLKEGSSVVAAGAGVGIVNEKEFGNGEKRHFHFETGDGALFQLFEPSSTLRDPMNLDPRIEKIIVVRGSGNEEVVSCSELVVGKGDSFRVNAIDIMSSNGLPVNPARIYLTLDGEDQGEINFKRMILTDLLDWKSELLGRWIGSSYHIFFEKYMEDIYKSGFVWILRPDWEKFFVGTKMDATLGIVVEDWSGKSAECKLKAKYR